MGGSYGGMLAYWLRAKFPNVFAAALASSAPITWNADPTGFYAVVAADFFCAEAIRGAFDDLVAAVSSPGGLATVSAALQLCTPLDTATQLPSLVAALQAQFTTFATLDYPYAANFTTPLPPNPANASCTAFARAQARGATSLEALGASLLFGAPLPVCFNLTVGPDSDPEALRPGLIPGAWAFQRCSELVLPSAVAPKNPMFLPCSDQFPANCWNISTFGAFCKAAYGVSPRPDFDPLFYDPRQAPISNIVFTNGRRDPWFGRLICCSFAMSNS